MSDGGADAPDPMATLSAVGRWVLDATMYNFYIVNPHEMALDAGAPKPDYMLRYGIPYFFFLISLEWVVTKVINYRRAEGKDKVLVDFRLNDSVVSTLLGSFQSMFITMCELAGIFVDVAAYTWVYENARLIDWKPSEHVYLAFFAALVVKDCGYYWAHRCMHTWHVMWTAHSVHHSGEDYNLPTALRQGATQPFFTWIFYIPGALLGIPPATFSAHSQINTMYMFWFHTDVVGRLPFGLEYILNTPMAHRSHHKVPGNCNYAGFLIIWDRMFGTYKPELIRQDAFGLAKQPNTFDLLRINTHHFNTMADIGDSNTSWLDRLTRRRARHKMVFKPLALFEPIPAQQKDLRLEGPQRKKWDGERPMGFWLKVYVSLVSLAGLAGVVMALMKAKRIHVADAYASVLCGAALLSYLGRVCDMREGESEKALAWTVVTMAGFYGFMLAQPFQTHVFAASA